MYASPIKIWQLQILKVNIWNHVREIRHKFENRENLEPDWYLEAIDVVRKCIISMFEHCEGLIQNRIIPAFKFNGKLFDMYELERDLLQLSFN